MWVRSLMTVVTALSVAWALGCEKQENEGTAKAPDQGQERGKGADMNPDHNFMASAAKGNLEEIAAGRLALVQSTSPDVKKFAQHMIDDHSQANRELSDLAQKMDVSLPSEPDESQQKEVSRLSGLHGHEFDQAFASLMVSSHMKAVALFEGSSKLGLDPEVRAFSQKTLPVIEDHLKMARDLKAKLAATPSAD